MGGGGGGADYGQPPGKPTRVEVTLGVNRIEDVDSVAQNFHIDVDMEFKWADMRARAGAPARRLLAARRRPLWPTAGRVERSLASSYALLLSSASSAHPHPLLQAS